MALVCRSARSVKVDIDDGVGKPFVERSSGKSCSENWVRVDREDDVGGLSAELLCDAKSRSENSVKVEREDGVGEPFLKLSPEALDAYSRSENSVNVDKDDGVGGPTIKSPFDVAESAIGRAGSLSYVTLLKPAPGRATNPGTSLSNSSSSIPVPISLNPSPSPHFLSQ